LVEGGGVKQVLFGLLCEKNAYEVLEGVEIEIPITTSVPVECIGSTAVIRKSCTQTLKIAQPGYQSDKCVNNIQEEVMVFKTKNCGVTFSTSNWQMPMVYNDLDRINDLPHSM
jgi:hypothetical protein